MRLCTYPSALRLQNAMTLSCNADSSLISLSALISQLRAKPVAMLPDSEPPGVRLPQRIQNVLRHYHYSSFVQSFFFSQPINNDDIRQDAAQRIFARRSDVFTLQNGSSGGPRDGRQACRPATVDMTHDDRLPVKRVAPPACVRSRSSNAPAPRRIRVLPRHETPRSRKNVHPERWGFSASEL